MSRTPEVIEQAGVASDLVSADEDIRRLAVERLALLDAEEGLPLLVEQLGDVSWRVRKTAAEHIARSAEVWRVTPDLIAALGDDENPGRRNSAVETLSAAGPVMVPALLLASSDADADVRKFAIDALAGIGDASAAPGLLTSLSDVDPNVRAAAAEALGATGGEGVSDVLLHRVQDDREEVAVRFSALRALAALECPVRTSELGKALADPMLCAAAFDLLGRDEDDGEAADVLIKGLEAGSRAQRESAIGGLLRCMALVDGPESLDLVRRIREAAAPGAPVVTGALEGLDASEAAATLRRVQFLGLLGLAEAVIPILRLAREERFSAPVIETLVEMGETAGRAIDAHWGELDALARRDACAVLAAIPSGLGEGRLLAALADPDLDARLAAMRAIGSRRMSAALPALLERLRAVADVASDDVSDEVRALVCAAIAVAAPRSGSEPVGREVIASLTEWLDDAATARRLAAAAILAGIVGAGDAAVIARLLRDPSAGVRRAAIEGLARLDAADAGELLRLALVDDSSRVRMAAVVLLGADPSPSALEDLLRLSDDDDVWVRAAAVRSLAAHGRELAGEERLPLYAVVDRALDDEVLVALGAIEVCAEVGDDAALRVGVVLGRPEPELVKEAIGCLEAHAPNDALEVLVPLVGHEEWSVRAEAIRALGARCVLRAMPAILGRLDVERDEFVREAVLRALERLEP